MSLLSKKNNLLKADSKKACFQQVVLSGPIP